MISHIKNILGYPKETSASATAEPLNKLAKDAGNYWSKSRNDEVTQDLSHWVGKGRWVDAKSWEEIGNKHFKIFENILSLTGKKPHRRMLEWGPGGGANTVCFSRIFDEYYGVDISAANLAECKYQLESRGFSKYHSIHIDPEKPEDCEKSVSAPIDFFLSTAVYQHFPGKEYGVLVTKTAYKLLVSGGLAIIQTRYDDGSEMLRPKNSDYNNHAITFTSYRIEEFWNICLACGFKPLMVNFEPASCYAYYLLVKGE